MAQLSGYGPAISVPPDDPPDRDPTPQPPAPAPERDFVLACYEDWNMTQLLPTFSAYDPKLRLIQAVDAIPNPREVSTTEVHNISLIYETPSVEPSLAFPFYVRGVAATALIVRAEFIDAVKASLLDIAEHVSRGGKLPTIDKTYSRHITRAERVIFGNGEHSSWLPLIAFMQGAFWLLGYIDRPTRRRGSYSPEEFVTHMLLHYGGLGYVPQ